MTRLPTPGGDEGNWGDILNDFLSQTHNSDGTLKDKVISASNLSDAINATLDVAQTAVQTVNGQSGQDITLVASDVAAISTSQKGAANGVASLDANSKLPVSQLTDNVVLTDPTTYSTGQVPSWDSTNQQWVSAAVGNNITDGIADGDIPVWNGTTSEWEPATPTTPTPASIGAASATDLTTLQTTVTALSTKTTATAGAYRLLFQTSGRFSGAGVSGTKYLVIPSNSDATSAAQQTLTVPWVFSWRSADQAVSGLTTMLKIEIEGGATAASGATATFGLYPIVEGASTTLGTVISGSTVALIAAANGITSVASSDFAPPADGTKCAIGYTLSATPTGSCGFVIRLFGHNI